MLIDRVIMEYSRSTCTISKILDRVVENSVENSPSVLERCDRNRTRQPSQTQMILIQYSERQPFRYQTKRTTATQQPQDNNRILETESIAKTKS